MDRGLQVQLKTMIGELLAERGLTIAGAPAGTAPGGAPPPVAPWLTPPGAAPALPQTIGWSVPIQVQVQGPRGIGKVTIDVAYPAETFQQVPEIIQGLIAQGYDVRVWVPQPKQQTGSGTPWRR